MSNPPENPKSARLAREGFEVLCGWCGEPTAEAAHENVVDGGRGVVLLPGWHEVADNPWQGLAVQEEPDTYWQAHGAELGAFLRGAGIGL